MYVHAETHGGQGYRVFDLDAGREIDRVIWADDEAGECEVYQTVSQPGFSVIRTDDYGQPMKEVRRGHIAIIRPGEDVPLFAR